MERESTAETVSRTHPHSQLSNCGNVKQVREAAAGKKKKTTNKLCRLDGGAHLLSVLLQEQQQLSVVVQSEAGHLGQNCVSVLFPQMTTAFDLSSLENTVSQKI